MKYYLGVDCGSVSIKGVVVDENNKIVKSCYTRNIGLINTIKEVMQNIKIDEEISSVGITGSGREFISALIGGDTIESEIIAHYIATITHYPDVGTIFDIGGEDCKLMIIDKGNLTAFQMNRDCVLPTDEVITKCYVPKKIKDIRVGEEILSHNGQFNPVSKVIKRDHNGVIYHINCGANKINVTENHPILVLKRERIKCYESKKRGIQICNKGSLCNKRCNKKNRIDFEPKFVTPNEVCKGDFLIQTIPNQSNNYKNKVFNNDFLRFLGYYLAEGNMEYNKSRRNKKIKYESGVALCFNTNEKGYIEDCMEILRNEGVNPKYKSCKNKRGIIKVYDSKFAKKIKCLCGEYSHKKSLNNDLFALADKELMSIIIGLFRGGGCLTIKSRKRALVLKTTSKILASQSSYILLLNNIKNTITCSYPKGKKQVYMVSINGEEINKLNDYEKILSKHKVSPMRCEYGYLNRIKEIKKEHYEGEVYNLTVSNDNSYVCNNLAVHNCGGGTGAMIESIAHRMNIQVEQIGEIALKSKTKVIIPSKCGIFAQSAVVSKLNKGVPKEDILMGVCRGLVGNYFTMLAKGIRLKPKYVFQGATAKNKALIACFEEELGEKVIVPENPHLMGAYGIALLAKEETKGKTNFKGFNNINSDFTTKTHYGKGCTNECEITRIYENGNLVGKIGNRCEKCVKPEINS